MRVQCSGSIFSKTFDQVAPGPRTAAQPAHHSFLSGLFSCHHSYLLRRDGFDEGERQPVVWGRGGDLPPCFDVGCHQDFSQISYYFVGIDSGKKKIQVQVSPSLSILLPKFLHFQFPNNFSPTCAGVRVAPASHTDGLGMLFSPNLKGLWKEVLLYVVDPTTASWTSLSDAGTNNTEGRLSHKPLCTCKITWHRSSLHHDKWCHTIKCLVCVIFTISCVGMHS